MGTKLNWEAFTSHDRFSSIEELKQVITANNGYIISYHMFSDLSLSLMIEIGEDQILKLHEELCKILTISDLDSTAIKPGSTREWTIFMSINFSKGTGNLSHEKPMVDG